MPKCAYCSGELRKGTGIMYVHRTGDIAYYCSNSCFRNHLTLKRKINVKLLKVNAPIAQRAATEKKEDRK